MYLVLCQAFQIINISFLSFRTFFHSFFLLFNSITRLRTLFIHFISFSHSLARSPIPDPHAESAHIQFLYLFLLVLMRDRCDIKGMTRYFSRFDCHSLKENNPNHFFMIPPTFWAVHHINTIVIRSFVRFFLLHPERQRAARENQMRTMLSQYIHISRNIYDFKPPTSFILADTINFTDDNHLARMSYSTTTHTHIYGRFLCVLTHSLNHSLFAFDDGNTLWKSTEKKKIGKTPNYSDDKALKSNQNTTIYYEQCVNAFAGVDDYIRRLVNLI